MARPILEFDPKRFGRAVRRLREARGLSRPQVSDQTGIPKGTIENVENARGIVGRGILCLAVWADFDTRDFVKINRRESRNGY